MTRGSGKWRAPEESKGGEGPTEKTWWRVCHEDPMWVKPREKDPKRSVEGGSAEGMFRVSKAWSLVSRGKDDGADGIVADCGRNPVEQEAVGGDRWLLGA